MSASLPFTGERFTPECVREIWYEHMHRYAFASQFLAGSDILDAACGEGYGSALLAGTARSVIGVDISAKTVAHARKRYEGVRGLSFECADCCALPFEDDRFDVVVSFETIEHLEQQQQLVAEFRRVLKPEGRLVLSSPDRIEYNRDADAPNEFHVRELDRDELEQLLRSEFPAIEWFGQRLMFHSVIGPEVPADSVQAFRMTDDRLETPSSLPQRPVYFLAICAATPELLPSLSVLSVFDDSEETVYRHYHGEIRRNMAAGGILAEREAELMEWKQRALDAEAGRAAAPWWRRWLGNR